MRLTKLNEGVFYVAPADGGNARKFRVEASTKEEAVRKAPGIYKDTFKTDIIMGTTIRAREAAWDVFTLERGIFTPVDDVLSGPRISGHAEPGADKSSYEQYHRNREATRKARKDRQKRV